ncbi:unnamed protein product [Gongylonema pulchrum]|uniref:Septal ring lytic transglycosylase RlpA family lipoprotein n=1 Tax=Gongylonema pulchrum TaxID=637853 RepID=A0A183EDU5_9BILA|nr:unnamed protein product [Gongylonema pulchrum]
MKATLLGALSTGVISSEAPLTLSTSQEGRGAYIAKRTSIDVEALKEAASTKQHVVTVRRSAGQFYTMSADE